MPNNTWTRIDSFTNTINTNIQIAFTGISTTDYKDLAVVLTSRSMGSPSSAAWASLTIQFNNNNAGYFTKTMFGTGTTPAADQSNSAAAIFIWDASSTSSANSYASNWAYIPNYASSVFKTLLYNSTGENAGASALSWLGGAMWQNTSQITSIQLTDGASFTVGSTATLYGIKNT